MAILVSQGVDRQRKKGLVEVEITMNRYKRWSGRKYNKAQRMVVLRSLEGGTLVREITFLLVAAVATVADVIDYMAPTFGQADGEAAPIFGVKIPPDTATGG